MVHDIRGDDVGHRAGRRLGGARRRRASRRSWPVRVYRSAQERFAEATSPGGADGSGPWTSSTAAAGLLLLSGAAVALAPIAVGELVAASSRDDARSGVVTAPPAPAPLPAQLPAAAVPGPADVAGALVASGEPTRAMAMAMVDDRSAALRVHRPPAQQYRAHHLAEDDDARGRGAGGRGERADDDDRGDDRDDDDRDDRDDDDREGGSDGSSGSAEVARSESDQVERGRAKAEREREEVEAERERIEDSR